MPATRLRGAEGDLVTMDFVGKTADGVAFEGGTGNDMAVEIGSGRLIPGFEDQLVGATAGEERPINVTFPDDYPAKELAGQPATFDLTVKSVKTAGESRDRRGAGEEPGAREPGAAARAGAGPDRAGA